MSSTDQLFARGSMSSGQTVAGQSAMNSFLVKRFVPKRYRPGNLGNWSAHLPFANDLIAALRPAALVELGTHFGESYFGFCQAVEENGVECKCFAVDTWRGDEHAGEYDEAVFYEVSQHNAENYSRFSTLLRTTFDDALTQFSDCSVELLHIDGLHTYQAVKHDFFSWLPKVRPGGVVLLHDTMARHADFGVWRLWEELCEQFANFEFFHGWGLGIVQVPGPTAESGLLRMLFSGNTEQQAFLRRYYAVQGENLDLRFWRGLSNVDRPRGRLTVYPCLEEGYSESTARSIELQSGAWERHAVVLPCGSRKGPIRIDPGDQVCIIELQQIAVCRAADAEKLAEWAGPALAQLRAAGDLAPISVGSSARYFSVGTDPQLYLPALPAQFMDQPLFVEIRIRTLFDLRMLPAPLVPLVPGGAEMDVALKESRERAAEMERQRDEAMSRRLLLEAQLTEARAEVRSHQAERLALMAEHRRNQALLEGYLREKEATELKVSATLQQELQSEHQARLELQAQYERERHDRNALFQSYSWRITKPLRRLYEVLSWGRRPKS
jgi:hypothetical protein